PGGKHVVASGGTIIAIWDIANAKFLANFQGETTSKLALSPDGRLVFSGGAAGAASSWETDTGKPVGRFPGNLPQVNAVAVSPDGRILACGSGKHDQGLGEIKLWDVATGKERAKWPHVHVVQSAAISPDGASLAAGAQSPDLKIWDLKTGKEQA